MHTVASSDSLLAARKSQSKTSSVLRCGGRTLRTEWDGEGQMTALGGIVHFAEYLRETGFLDCLLRGAPLKYGH